MNRSELTQHFVKLPRICKEQDHDAVLARISEALNFQSDQGSRRDLGISSIPLLKLRAQIYLAKADYSAALTAIEEAISIDNTIPMLDSSSQKDALEKLKRTIVQEALSCNQQLHILTEQYNNNAKNFENALLLTRLLKDMLALDPKNDFALKERAELLPMLKLKFSELTKQTPVAIKKISDAIQVLLAIDPTDQFALTVRARFLERILEHAQTLFQALLVEPRMQTDTYQMHYRNIERGLTIILKLNPQHVEALALQTELKPHALVILPRHNSQPNQASSSALASTTTSNEQRMNHACFLGADCRPNKKLRRES